VTRRTYARGSARCGAAIAAIDVAAVNVRQVKPTTRRGYTLDSRARRTLLVPNGRTGHAHDPAGARQLHY